MYTTLLTVRYRQLIYSYHQLSWFNRLLLLVLLCAATAASFLCFRNSRYAMYACAAIAVTVLSLQLSRKDKHFVWLHLEKPQLAIAIEYAVYSLPVTITALLTRQWYYFFILQCCFMAIANLRSEAKERVSLVQLSRYLPATYFEWVSGIRKNRWFVLPLYILSVATCWVPFLPLVLLWLCTAAISGFYIECEPLQVLWTHTSSARQLLRQKLRKHILLLVVLYGPVLVLQLLFHLEYWYLPPAFLLLQVLVVSFAIVYKYKLYAPGRMLMGNTLLTSLVHLSAILPFLLPMPVLMLAIYYRPAIENLKTYTDD